MKKTVCLILLVVIVITTTVSCGPSSMEEGDFVYNIRTKEDGTKYAAILELSEEGKKKDVLVVPELIGGYKVEKFTFGSAAAGDAAKTKNTNLKRIYFPYDVEISEMCFINCTSIERILLITPNQDIKHNATRYPSTENNISRILANVTYILDGELYWIDDYEYGSKIEYQPSIPTKEGYIFDGWYKDSDCMTKWVFETDILPEEALDINKQIVYQETILYAKWNKGD